MNLRPNIALVADPMACGMGQGERCCAWLGAGRDGFECQRGGDLRNTIEQRALAGQTGARRLPDALFPHCQLKDER